MPGEVRRLVDCGVPNRFSRTAPSSRRRPFVRRLLAFFAERSISPYSSDTTLCILPYVGRAALSSHWISNRSSIREASNRGGVWFQGWLFLLPSVCRRLCGLRDPCCRTRIVIHCSIVFAATRGPVAPGSMIQNSLCRQHIGLLTLPNLQRRLFDGAGKRKRQRPRQSRLESDIHGIQTGRGQFSGLAARQERNPRNGG